MSNSNFSSLIYRIIGKPERWHDDYIVEMMQQYLDEADAVNDPQNSSELAAGDQLLSRLQQGNVALNAFNALLDKSRFQLIILDEDCQPVYHNNIANRLFDFVSQASQNNGKPGTRQLRPELVRLIQTARATGDAHQQNTLHALDFCDETGAQVYLRSIESEVMTSSQPTLFHMLMVLDDNATDIQLNSELVSLYSFTDKEQNVLRKLIHGDTIKAIAESSFVTENTIRSHLKALFRKTNTNSQGALISLVLTHESQVLDSYFDSDITTAGYRRDDENDREVTLPSGLKIAYCEYGPEDGRPLIVFHSGFGSRLAIPPGYQEICERTRRRIIVPDRPGLGKTPFVQGHPDTWNQRLAEFVNLLGLEEYDVLGSIISCQMAVSYAAYADERLKRVILTSPVVLNDQSHTQYLTEILAPAAKYVRMSPTFAKEIYELWLKSITLNLDAHYPSLLNESIGSNEREQFEKDNVIQVLTDVFKEGARQSLDGILNEMVFCMTPLELDLDTFDKPLDVWFGTDDKRITLDGVKAIFSEFPEVNLHIKEGYSEHLYYALLEDIIA